MTNDFISVYDRLETMRDRDQRHIPFEFVPERCLYDHIRFVICVRHELRQHRASKPTNGKPLPIADVAASAIKDQREPQQRVRGKHVPSSRMSNLLPRTIARASANICRWPTERLPPPLAIWPSRVRRPSSSSPCRENRPDARRALFSVASSYWENGSRFSRSKPLNDSGYMKRG